MTYIKRFATVVLITGFAALGAQTAPAGETKSGSKKENISEGKSAPQEKRDNLPQKRSFVIKRGAEVNFSEIRNDFAPTLLIREMPKQGASKIIRREETGPQAPAQRKSQAPLLPLVKGQSFLANPFSISTPNDNDMAISDSGRLISVINTNIYVRNIVTQMSSPVKSLFSFTQPINNLQDEFDPKVMYDPSKDRFVLVCMVGFVDSTSKIIVGFSQTGNPAGTWNLYQLPGDPLQYNLWSDYPMIAMTEDELFLTVNLLYNDSSWQTGFVETVIWQMAKDSGYAGTNLTSQLHNNIKPNGRPLRNLCPVKGGSRLYGPEMYFLSNRNLDSQNDTVFLVKVGNKIGAPGNVVTVTPLKSNLPYRFPPDGVQKGTNQLLATNDSRNLGAFIENGIIQYVHNTKHPVNNRPTVHYGVIHNAETSAPIVTGFVVENDSLDYGYPNISYAGLDSTDNSAIITFNHSSPSVFPGCSAIQADGFGSFSPVLNITNGINYVNLLQGDLERWGDYSGSQRRYSKPGEVWMSGYYGYPFGSSFPKAHAAWVAQITTDAGIYVSNAEQQTVADAFNVFPNPAPQLFSVEFSLTEPEYLTFELVDAKGSRTILLRDWVKVKTNTFSFNTNHLAKGVYLLNVSGNKGTVINRKLLIE